MFIMNDRAKEEVYGRKIGDYEINVLVDGEEGRGRRELRLVINKDVPLYQRYGERTFITKEFTTDKIREFKNLTVTTTRSGKPKLIKGDDKEYSYILISSAGGYTRRGGGWIQEESEKNAEIIAEGWGADGDAGRIGKWEVALYKIRKDKTYTFKVKPSGGNPFEIIYINKNKPLFFKTIEDFELYLDMREEGVE